MAIDNHDAVTVIRRVMRKYHTQPMSTNSDHSDHQTEHLGG